MSDDAPFNIADMEARLSECVVLPDHQLALGLQHRDGAGLRVCAWNGSVLRHMAPAAAKRWANDLAEGPFCGSFKPVIEALRNLADRALELAEPLADMPVKGNA